MNNNMPMEIEPISDLGRNVIIATLDTGNSVELNDFLTQ